MNVASECEYTHSNYQELTKLQAEYQDRGFTVLGFPSNQFDEQEPGSNQEILEFAKSKFDLNFPLFSKVDVLGEGSCELYKYLYSETASQPSWNFCKYLVDQNGDVVQFLAVKEPFDSLRVSLDYLLNKNTKQL